MTLDFTTTMLFLLLVIKYEFTTFTIILTIIVQLFTCSSYVGLNLLNILFITPHELKSSKRNFIDR